MEGAVPYKYCEFLESKNVTDYQVQISQEAFTFERSTLLCTKVPNATPWFSALRGDSSNLGQTRACHIKLYDELIGQFRLNENIEFVGVLNYTIGGGEESKETGMAVEEEDEFFSSQNKIPNEGLYPHLHAFAFVRNSFLVQRSPLEQMLPPPGVVGDAEGMLDA